MREVLVVLAESGVVELAGPLGSGEGPALDALRRLESRQSGGARAQPSLARVAPDVDRLERSGARAELAGEVELERRRTSAVRARQLCRVRRLGAEAGNRTAVGAPGGVRRVARPATPASWPTTADTARSGAGGRPVRPLLSTYGAVPYRDVDPTPFVAVTYCLMFGMMFGDVGDGLLILVAALALRGARGPRFAALRRVWPMIAAAGAASVVFGALYGELFGPTNLLPTLWLSPLDESTRLLAVAIAAGAGLLAVAYLIGIVNRWREGGPALALTAGSGVPGIMLLTGGGLVAAGVAIGAPLLEIIGLVLAAASLVPLTVGLRAQAGGGATGVLEVVIGLFDALVRLFSNVFSFARLAAFGLMHAAIGQVVLHAAGSLLGTPVGDVAAVVTFAVGWAVAFALEGLVVAVQALRLEYYELFSRLFVGEGRPFRPFRLPLLSIEEAR